VRLRRHSRSATNVKYALSQMMAQGFQQMGQQQPDTLHQVLGPGGMLGNPMAKMAVAGLAAVAAKNILGGGGFGL
jgi:hypothetical protein